MLIGAPPGPSGSTIAGILLLGLILTKAGANCSPLLILTGLTVYGSPISSSATLILRPLGVFQVWSSMVIAIGLYCCHGRTQKKYAALSSISRKRGTRSNWAQCRFAAAVAL